MKTFRRSRNGHSGLSLCCKLGPVSLLIALLGDPAQVLRAQASSQAILAEKVKELSAAMAKTEAQLEQSQQQLDTMRKELSELERQLAQGQGAVRSDPVSDAGSSSSQQSSGELAAAVADIRDQQALDQSQIATLDQSKIESASKYPVKVTGMLLLNGFVNTSAVDLAATPTVAVRGSGNTGATLRQTVLGFDANGPHLFGARSYADLQVDFAANPTLDGASTSYAGYLNPSSSFLRLRTAHARLQWDRTEAYFALDRPIVSPESPTSLIAVAEPAFAWSGNLWTWNPQVGITQAIGNTGFRGLELQAALIDAGDAPLTPAVSPTVTYTTVPPSSAEQSSRPGVEARIGLGGSVRDLERSHVGVGGYFAPHHSSLGRSFDSWAGTFDARFSLFAHLQFSGSAYRGLGLGGLGGGGFKDFAYKLNPITGGYYFKALDDVGGWAQLKEKLNERLEFNAAYGMDNVFAGEMRHYIVAGGTIYQNLTINRTFTGNVIYAPSAYLLFSVEYRHLESSPITATPARSDIVGIGAGYKF